MEKDIDIIEKYWDGRSSTFDKDHDSEDIDRWRVELNKLCENKQDLKVLDIGTGTGFLAIIMAELGHDVTGVDVSEGMMSYAKQHAADRNVAVAFIKTQGEEMPFEDNTFDVIVNCRLLWTLIDPVKSFKEWLRVLKPGGRMFSFMRKKSDRPMKKMNYYDELKTELPLRDAPTEKYYVYLEAAGFVNPKVTEMIPELTIKKIDKDGSVIQPWECIYGEKAK